MIRFPCAALGIVAWLALVLPLGLVLSPSTANAWPSRAIADAEVTVGLWRLSAHERADGRFSHCAISAPFSNGVTLVLAMADSRTWRLGLVHSGWSLGRGDATRLAVEADGRAPAALMASSPEPWMVTSDWLEDRALLDRLRESKRLAVTGGTARHEFQLRDMREALAVLEGCAESRTQSPGSRTSATIGAPTATSASSEALLIFSQLIEHDGLSGLERLDGAEVRALGVKEPEWEIYWRASSLVGAFRILPADRRSPTTDIAAVIIADEGRGCVGRFGSGSLSYEGTNGGIRLFVVCDGTNGFTGRYAILPRAAGGFYLYALVALSGRAEELRDLATLDDCLARALAITASRGN